MAIIKKYKAVLEKIINPIQGVYTLVFYSEKKFKYKPGQFLHLALDDFDPAKQWPESRCFSIQSSPESSHIIITYTVKGAFTKRMAKELIEGAEVWLKLPYGELFQTHHKKNDCVFIAGGTGVTPFISLFHDTSFLEYKSPKLYFGVRSISFNIFSNEIKQAQLMHPNFNVDLKFEDTHGILDINKIYIENRSSTFFISGPPNMVIEFRKSLNNSGVEQKRIITDDWE